MHPNTQWQQICPSSPPKSKLWETCMAFYKRMVPCVIFQECICAPHLYWVKTKLSCLLKMIFYHFIFILILMAVLMILSSKSSYLNMHHMLRKHFCICWNEKECKFKIPNPGSLKIMKSFNSICYPFMIGLVNILRMWFGSYSIYNSIMYFFCCKMFWALPCQVMNLCHYFAFLSL